MCRCGDYLGFEAFAHCDDRGLHAGVGRGMPSKQASNFKESRICVEWNIPLYLHFTCAPTHVDPNSKCRMTLLSLDYPSTGCFSKSPSLHRRSVAPSANAPATTISYAITPWLAMAEAYTHKTHLCHVSSRCALIVDTCKHRRAMPAMTR